MTLFHNVTMQAFVFQQYTEKLLKALGLHSCKFKFSVPLRNRVRKYHKSVVRDHTKNQRHSNKTNRITGSESDAKKIAQGSIRIKGVAKSCARFHAHSIRKT